MRTFLLDTNIWEYWFNRKGHPKESDNIQRRIEQLINQEQNIEQFVWQPVISVITWGEIDYGYKVTTKKEQSREAEFRKFLSSINPWTVSIDRHVAKTYGELRARLFEKCAPKDKKKKKLRPEQLIDPATSLELKIQENDLWITAQAVTFNLTLVTNDKKMRHIHEVAGGELYIENWAGKKYGPQ